jgi:hypothetical protein
LATPQSRATFWQLPREHESSVQGLASSQSASLAQHPGMAAPWHSVPAHASAPVQALPSSQA